MRVLCEREYVCDVCGHVCMSVCVMHVCVCALSIADAGCAASALAVLPSAATNLRLYYLAH